MTPGVSVTFFKPEFNDFLYAPISADGSAMPLSVLSALSRLDIDPWQEAAELCELPTDSARQRLVTLLSRLPDGSWAQKNRWSIADRLIELLPRRGSQSLAPEAPRAIKITAHAKILICAALGAFALIVAASFEPSQRDDHGDSSAVSKNIPPQTSVPSSR